MPETRHTFCRICESLCGLEVTLDGGRVTQIRPDEEHVATGGFGCTFPNPDDAGSGAYGNGVSEAADPSACGGATMLPSSGTITEGSFGSGRPHCRVLP